MKTAQEWIDQLKLEGHMEGGFFSQVYQSPHQLASPNGDRPSATSIYFLLTPQSPSRLHQLVHDELWYYHAGNELTVHCFGPQGYYSVSLGPDPDKGQVLFAAIPGGTIFGSSVAQDYVLVSCVVTPGFDYQDFRLVDAQELLEVYPDQADLIRDLT